MAVVRLLASEVHQRQVAGVLVTHDMRMAAYADRVVQVRDGWLQETSISEVR
jgi:putative ABC transport system ATP-binding protein